MLSQKIVLIFLSAVIIYPSWFVNSSYFRDYRPLTILITALSTLLLFSPLLDKKSDKFNELKKRFLSILKDPIFYFGITLISFIFIQYLNSGAIRSSEPNQAPYIWYKATRFANLPFSVNEYTSWRLLLWAFSSFIIILAIRHAISKRQKSYLIGLILINASLLGIVGLAQFGSKTGKMLWMFDSEGDYFYSTFGYENFGGAFFTLMLAVTCGVFINAVVKFEGKTSIAKIAFSILALPVFSVSIFLCHTRFCYLEFFIIIILFSISLLWIALRRFNWKIGAVTVLIIAVGCFFIFNYIYTAEHHAAKELQEMTTNVDKFIKREFSARTWQWEATTKLWKDYPIYGTGHDSMKYVQYLYLDPNYYNLVQTFGKANTHNDFLQYLSELGIVGMTLLLFITTWLFVNGIQSRFWREPILFWIFIGIGANAVHSLIDLPYRNCCNIFTTATLLALISCYQKPTVNVKPPTKLFKTTSLIALFALLLYLGNCVLLPVKIVKSERLILQAQKATNLTEKLSILQKAEDLTPRTAEVRRPLTETMFEIYKTNKDPQLLKKATFYAQQLYLNDNTEENTLLYASLMQESGHIWEAWGALLNFYQKNPESEAVFEALKFHYLRQGKHEKIVELIKNRKVKK